MSRRRPTASEALGAALAELGEDPHPEDVLEAVEAFYNATSDEERDPSAAEVATDNAIAVRGCIAAIEARRAARRLAIEIRSDEGPYLLRQVSR